MLSVVYMFLRKSHYKHSQGSTLMKPDTSQSFHKMSAKLIISFVWLWVCLSVIGVCFKTKVIYLNYCCDYSLTFPLFLHSLEQLAVKFPPALQINKLFRQDITLNCQHVTIRSSIIDSPQGSRILLYLHACLTSKSKITLFLSSVTVWVKVIFSSTSWRGRVCIAL